MKTTLKTGKKHTKLIGMDKDSHIIKLLKSAYEKSGKTYQEIGKETDISQSFLSRFFNGSQSASLAMFIRIGQVVGLDTEQITKAWKKDKIAEIDAEIAKFLRTT
jgi:transcriptional regulator with XRE-family HTH domain